MTRLTPLIPRQAVPSLEVPTLDGKTWRLSDQKPENFTLIVVYRGFHCPICSNYLRDLNRKLGDFAERGIGVVAISGDQEDRARKAKEDWRLDNLTIGFGLDLDTARSWGLFISSGIGTTSAGVEEPALFPEPGTFLVRADGTLYFSSVQTMPFARPHFDEMLKAADSVLAKNYPARGEVIDHTTVQAAE